MCIPFFIILFSYSIKVYKYFFMYYIYIYIIYFYVMLSCLCYVIFFVVSIHKGVGFDGVKIWHIEESICSHVLWWKEWLIYAPLLNLTYYITYEYYIVLWCVFLNYIWTYRLKYSYYWHRVYIVLTYSILYSVDFCSIPHSVLTSVIYYVCSIPSCMYSYYV